jgi:hypothetical protein
MFKVTANRFGERMMTIVATLEQQHRNVLLTTSRKAVTQLTVVCSPHPCSLGDAVVIG